MTTANDVAAWMDREVRERGELYQDEAFYFIAENFGEEFAYPNDRGSLTIDKAVLQTFNKLTENDIVWSRGYRHWRRREKGDEPGRMQP